MDFVTLVFGTLSVSAVQCAITWLQTQTINVETSAGRLATPSTNTLSRCIVECYVIEDCVYVGFGSGKCLLHDYTFPETNLQATTYDIVYYAKACDINWETFQQYIPPVDGCLYKSAGPRISFQNATEFCEEMGGELPYVIRQETLDYFLEHRESDNEKLWVGATMDPFNSSVWYWITGELINSENGGQLWRLNRPRSDPFRACAVLKYENSTGEYGMWDIDCSMNRNVVCVKYLDLNK